MKVDTLIKHLQANYDKDDNIIVAWWDDDFIDDVSKINDWSIASEDERGIIEDGFLNREYLWDEANGVLYDEMAKLLKDK